MLKDLSYLLAKTTNDIPIKQKNSLPAGSNLRFWRVSHTCLGCGKQYCQLELVKQCKCEHFVKSGLNDARQSMVVGNQMPIAKNLSHFLFLPKIHRNNILEKDKNKQNIRVIDPEKSAAASEEVIAIMASVREQSQMRSDRKLPNQIQFGNESSAFVRMDAGYKCKGCGAIYFTRDEVEACFDGHNQSLP